MADAFQITQPAADAPFTPLGFDRGTYFYLAAGTQQVIPLAASAHTKANLLQLAPLHFWESEFPGRQGVNCDMATNALMRWCEARGVFSPTIMRGRGAWYDAGRIMVHLGDRVLVDGVPVKPGRVDSRFVYEARVPMRADMSNPLTAEEAHRFQQLLHMLPWEKPMHATLAAGWCVVAHIGGVLSWRPHIWVIGRRGSGKTHVMSRIIRPVLSDNVLHAQGETSEAGLRQSLGIDALPVLFDEAEGPDARANDRVQNVLSLVRQSSSETGGKILKGTTGGRSMEFNVRSCFAFSSINANIVQQADRSRVTVLELNQDHAKHAFADILKAEADLLTDDYIRRFYARSLAMAATIRHNAAAFTAAAASVLREQRAGDQIGTLLAGAYALTSDDEVTAQQAEAWVQRQDWTEQREEAQSQSDEFALLQYLMEQRIRLNCSLGLREYPLGMLVQFATKAGAQETAISQDAAREAIEGYGFKLSGDERSVYVSNTHSLIARMLNGTPWAVNWGRILKRLPGAIGSGAVRFAGSVSRATQIPLDAIGVSG